jgi:hypothetical protein
MMRFALRLAGFGVALALGVTASSIQVQVLAQTDVTSPEAELGFQIGADYELATYAQLTAYWERLARESDRMRLESIGLTAEGRDQWMAIITSPDNHSRLDRYQEIAQRLARAEDLTDDEARELAAEGKTVVWIDGGLHATEVLGAQQLIELVYQMVSGTDAETLRFLDDIILLAVHCNPDGHALVADWYMREPDPEQRTTSGLPRLYQKYVGHDNNRDFYMSTQPETVNMNRVLYREWFPQIVYNHHQSGPAGAVLFAPPFRGPFNYVYDPLIPIGLDLIGAAMHSRFAVEGKPGATMTRGGTYSTWWNGGLRTTPYFHNMLGLLTEMIGHPTPIEIPFLPERQLPSVDTPYPIAPQPWHFRQSIEYSMTANRAVLDVASRHREQFLFNIYRMGQNAIARGSRDTWTTYPGRVAEVQAAIADEAPSVATGPGRRRGAPLRFFDTLRDPALRDPRGYILPADQADFLTATKFVNALIKNGVTVHRATTDFEVDDAEYRSGSYVVRTAQAFRPHVLDMFEPQDHPNDLRYPGGPPIPPYDNAGWTLAYQMGIEFDRILEPFDGPFEVLADVQAPPPGRVVAAIGATGFLLSHETNDAFVAVNRLLAAGEAVYWLTELTEAAGATRGPGTMFIPAGPTTEDLLREAAADLGLTFIGVREPPTGPALKLRPVRIGLWDRYGGSMPSGWLRWLLEEFEFPYERVFPQTLDAGNLVSAYDVLIFVNGAIPDADRASPGDLDAVPAIRETVPEQFLDLLGATTVSETVPRLGAFVERGGTLLALGSSTSIGRHLELPLTNHLMEKLPGGGERLLTRDDYYIPGSVLRMQVDNTHPLAFGMDEEVDVFFNNSPVLRLTPDATRRGVTPVAWFDDTAPLRSGWAWGQHYLEGGVGVVDATVGAGKVFLYGPEMTHRAQPHGTFKLVFNGIYYGTAEEVVLDGRVTAGDRRR